MRDAPRHHLCLALIGMLLLIVGASGSAAQTPPGDQKCILVLHSYHHGFTWSDSISRGIRSVFGGDPQFAELRFDFMDTRHVATAEYLDSYAAMLQAKYAARCLDAVICADDHAFQFMLERGETVAPGVPIVFCSVNGSPPEAREGRQLTGLRESLAIGETLALGLRLHPATREVIVLTDESRTGQILRTRAEAEFAPLADRVAIRYIQDKTVEELQSLAPTFGEDALVFLLGFGADRRGRVFSHEENLARLAPHCPVPIYSVWDFYLDHGIVGGKLADGELEGALAASLARRILAGEEAAAIPLGESPTRYKFDWRQLDRFAIDEADLPPGSVVINRPSSAFRKYRTLVWSTLVVLAILAGLTVALALSNARRRRVEIEVRASERRLRAVFAGATNVAFIIADASGTAPMIHEFSPGAERIFGYQRDEIVGDDAARLLLAKDAARLPAVLRHLRDSRRGIEGELTLVRKDDKRFPAWLTTHPLLDDEGHVYAVLAVGIDVSDRKRAEEARERLEKQLRQAQRMEAVGQLAGGVAHDFNNLLQAIMGYSELAQAETEPGGRARASIDEVLNASQRARRLVSQLLAFSRRQVLEITDVDLNDAVADVMSMLRRVLGEHVEVTVVPGRELGTVRADRGQIGQILTNLCVNSRDAMPGGGTIVIETENVSIDATFCEQHAWAEPGRYVMLSVTDDGAGMDEETLNHIFEPFFTTKEVGKGTGLGLATVYGLVRQHDGLVHVDSEVGRGTTFKIYLPLAERGAGSVGDRIAGPVPGGTETILLAEDDEKVRRLSRLMLERVGYRVIEAADGEEALAAFAERPGSIDLAILDVVMPRLGGDAVYERMREMRPPVRVLFSSGYSLDGIHTGFVLDEGLALIQKPYRHRDLLRRVREVLDQDSRTPA